MVEAEAENLLRDYDNNLRMQGMSLADFVKYTGMSLDAMREQFKPRAERQVKTRLALEKIAELEKIEVSEKELEDEYNRIATMYSIDVAEVKKSIEDENLKKDIAVQKAVDLVKAESVVAKAKAKKEAKAEEGEEKPAAKKTTAKKTTTTKKTAAKKAEDKAE